MKNTTFIGTCVDLTEQGLGIVKNQGFCYFVKNCLVGEEVEVLITNVKKNYGYGIVKRFVKPSPYRIEPACKVSKQCGGCQLQHLEYQSQLSYKTKHVKDCFDRIGKLEVEVQNCLGMDNPYQYRNKVQVPVQGNNPVKIGFYRNNTNDIVEYDTCAVQTTLQNQILNELKKAITQLKCGELFRHILIKHSFKTNEVMVVFIVKEHDVKKMNDLAKKCTEQFSEIKSIIVNINKRNDNVILGDQEILIYGKETIQDELDGLLFNISSKSFYQINPVQTKTLYNKAIQLANLSGNETVVDLYCGIGTIGLFASRFAKKVIGIEIVPEAIEDAKRNAKLNHIEKISFVCGDAGECAQRLIEDQLEIDVVIVDPPRKGLDQNTIESIIKMNPKKLIYVSCDPSTLARDCKILSESYKIEHVQPVDMFPQTTHVETVVLMSR